MGNRFCSGLISLSFLSVSSAISVPRTFLVFSVLSALSVVFVHKMVPETKGKTLEQVVSLFQERGGLREGQRGWQILSILCHENRRFHCQRTSLKF